MNFTLSVVMAVVALITFLLSVLTKIMHWPGTGYLRIASLTALVVAGVALYIYQQQLKSGSLPNVNKKPVKPEKEEEIVEEDDFWEFDEDEEQ